jgi:hypothetical protein
LWPGAVPLQWIHQSNVCMCEIYIYVHIRVLYIYAYIYICIVGLLILGD